MPAPTTLRQNWSDTSKVLRPSVSTTDFEDRETMTTIINSISCYFIAVGGALEPDAETARTTVGTAKIVYANSPDIQIGDVIEMRGTRWKVYNLQLNRLTALKNTVAYAHYI